MPGTETHSIHRDQSHLGWDNSIPPVLSVIAGETVEFEVIDASGGQLNAGSTVDDIAGLDFSQINPVTGPVFVEGAEPGDALKVTLLEFVASGWGWTANIPGFGLLADQFAEPALHVWNYDRELSPAAYGPADIAIAMINASCQKQFRSTRREHFDHPDNWRLRRLLQP